MVNSGAEIQIEQGKYTRIHNAILEQLAYHDRNSRVVRLYPLPASHDLRVQP